MKLISRNTLGLLSFLSLSATSATALASQGGWYSNSVAAAACWSGWNSPATGLGIDTGRLVNRTGKDEWAVCPVQTGVELSDAYMTVSSGFATTGTCWMAADTGATQWTWSPTITNLNPQQDQVAYHLGWTWTDDGIVLICRIPPGEYVYNYSSRTYLFFDWTSW